MRARIGKLERLPLTGSQLTNNAMHGKINRARWCECVLLIHRYLMMIIGGDVMKTDHPD